MASAAVGALVTTGGAAWADDANTLELRLEPGVPASLESFQVTAEGIATKQSEVGNVRLVVTIGPGSQACASTAALEQARAEDMTLDDRWGVWTEGFLGSVSPEGDPYLHQQVFSGRPLGRYRLCGYTAVQGPGTDPLAAQRIDFTIGGTCSAATQRVASAQRTVAKRVTKVRALRKKVRAQRAKDRPRVVIKKTRQKLVVKQRQLKVARTRLVDVRADRDALC